MSYFIATSISFGALLLFVVLLAIERKRGKKIFSKTRERLDTRVARVIYILNHIDWGAFFGHVLKLSLEKLAHDIVHGVLLIVRTIERSLTRAIRILRERLAYRSDSAHVSDGFELTKTIQRFRKNLKRETKDKT